ncbi:hypothetical protein Ciccas_009715 [Cichlidogyrus casuarinus]|uniref:Uncharacterized protein n=1 Tax=Cichlidogyrus casuarinus TaxID=1844966 RepID=A0ABD2PX82_9PLAT
MVGGEHGGGGGGGDVADAVGDGPEQKIGAGPLVGRTSCIHERRSQVWSQDMRSNELEGCNPIRS